MTTYNAARRPGGPPGRRTGDRSAGAAPSWNDELEQARAERDALREALAEQADEIAHWMDCARIAGEDSDRQRAALTSAEAEREAMPKQGVLDAAHIIGRDAALEDAARSFDLMPPCVYSGQQVAVIIRALKEKP